METAFFASHELNQVQTILCYPCLGLVQPDKSVKYDLICK